MLVHLVCSGVAGQSFQPGQVLESDVLIMCGLNSPVHLPKTMCLGNCLTPLAGFCSGVTELTESLK